MSVGALTSHIDVAQVVLYVFWLFFFALVVYLRREDRREGYPLEYDRPGAPRSPGAPAIPKPKTFRLPNGEIRMAPRPKGPAVDLKAKPLGPWPGAPLVPTGDAMQDGVGPAAYNTSRAAVPEMTFDGQLRCVPMRVATDFWVDEEDPDPRGMTVYGTDKKVGGTVSDLWVDRAEPSIRYLEVAVEGAGGARKVLIPMNMVGFSAGAKSIVMSCATASQIQAAPGLAKPDEVNQLEEDRLCAYYAGGTLFADPKRLEPIL